MRVLLIVHGFPPAACGGTEIYTQQFARALGELAGVEAIVLSRESDSSRPEYSVRMQQTADGQPVYRINNTFQACTSFEDSYANQALAGVAARLIEEIDPDVLHVQHLTCLSTGILEHASARGTPVVMTLNDYWLMCHRGQLLCPDGSRCEGPFEDGCASCIPAGLLVNTAAYRAGRMARALPLPGAGAAVRAASRLRERCASAEVTRAASKARLEHLRRVTGGVDLVLAPSGTMEQWALRFGIERRRLVRCGQGIDVRPFVQVTRRSADTLRLAFVGSLIPSKAPHVLLEAVGAVPAGRVSVDLLGTLSAYHGDERYAARLAPLLGQPFVRKLGPIPHDRMADALSDVDALVVPSEWIENAPFVIREAFAAGLPVLASGLGGMAEMVRHDVDGLLFAPGSAAALGAHIVRLLDDPGLIARLRHGIRPPMSIEQDAIEMRTRYERLLHSRARRVRVRPPITPAASAAANVGAVVLNYQTPEQTWLAVRSIQTSTVSARTWVVDNGSADGSFERLSAALPGVEVLDARRNLGFSGGCNAGIHAARDAGVDFILLVNSDAVLMPDAIESLLAAASANPAAGVFAPVILAREEPDRVASAGIRFSTRTGRMRHVAAGQPFSRLRPATAEQLDAVSGCVMLVRREVFGKVGLLDEAFFFSFEDIEFCLRARKAGFDVLCVPEAVAYHEGGRSIGRTSPQRVYFAARNHLRLVRMAAAKHRAPWLRGGFIVGLNAAYVLLSGETPRLRGFAALARGVWHHLGRRYGPG